MSDTPRTDELAIVWQVAEPRDGREMVSADFARELERELAAAKANSQEVVISSQTEINDCRAGNQRLRAERDAAREELAELRKDKERLDWFEKHFMGQGEPDPKTNGGTIFHIKFTGAHSHSLRECIDYARSPISK